MSLIDDTKTSPSAEAPAVPLNTRKRPKSALRLPGWRESLPFLALAIILVAILVVVPGARSYSGFGLLLSGSMAIILAAMAQMFIITAGDIDLGLGAYIGLTNVICATQLQNNPPLAIAAMLASLLAYSLLGAIIHIRRIPAMVVTLGASFVWLGIAILVLPTPGGQAPPWLVGFFNLNPPLVPLPIIVALVVGAFGHWFMMRTAYGVILRGIGGNAKAIRRAGWSLLRARVTLYAMAGLFGILSGLAVTGQTTSGDANVSLDYTLLTIASVILGGGDFSGGKAAAFGTVVGAITMSMASSLLVFMQLPPDYQLGVQGLILILVLAGRAVGKRKEA